MNTRPKDRRRLPVLTMLFVGAWIALLCRAGDTSYTYDALGRLTSAARPDGVRTIYTLDAAGNRTQVQEGPVSGPALPPPPPAPPAAPTGLLSNQNSQCSWTTNWNASAGASSYMVRDRSGNFLVTVTTNSAVYSFCGTPDYTGNPDDYKPKWVKACNASGCGAQA